MKKQPDPMRIKFRQEDKHMLFGKPIKRHFFISDKWNPCTRKDQFRYMVDLLQKHIDYVSGKNAYCSSKNKNLVKELKDHCNLARKILREGEGDDSRKARSILDSVSELKQLYILMHPLKAEELINHKTFQKRKRRDSLVYECRKMTQLYHHKLTELSALQDRVKYQNEFVLTDEIDAGKCKKSLKDSSTRLLALQQVNSAFDGIIKVLLKDGLSYGPVIDELERDIKEQEHLINQTIYVGSPAIKQVEKLEVKFQKVEDATRESLIQNFTDLAEKRKLLGLQREYIRGLIREDTDYVYDHDRYLRETPSMVELKLQLEDAIKTMKEIKHVTPCAHAKQAYAKLKKKKRWQKKLVQDIRVGHTEKNMIELKSDMATALEDFFKYNYNDAVIKRIQTNLELTERINNEKEEQKNCDKHLKARGEIFYVIRCALYQIADVMRNVTEPIGITRRLYPDPDLKLPLLKFTEFARLPSIPPRPFEENCEKILYTVRERIRETMVTLRRERSEDVELGRAKYHTDYLASLVEDGTQSEKSDHGALEVVELEDKEDPRIPTRKHIKAMSERIIAEQTREDEQT